MLVPASCILTLMREIYVPRSYELENRDSIPPPFILQIARRSRTTKPPTTIKADRQEGSKGEKERRKHQERSAKQRSLSLAMLACGREEHHLSQYLLFVPACPETPSFTCLRRNSEEKQKQKVPPPRSQRPDINPTQPSDESSFPKPYSECTLFCGTDC